MTFSVDITDAIDKACKKKGVSVMSAVQAEALAKNPDLDSRLSHYDAYNMFTLRSLPARAVQCKQLYHLLVRDMVTFLYQAPLRFLGVARGLNTQCKMTFQEGGVKATHNCDAITAVIIDAKMNRLIPVYKDAIVSSWGVVERFYQRTYTGTSNLILHVDLQDFRPQVDMV